MVVSVLAILFVLAYSGTYNLYIYSYQQAESTPQSNTAADHIQRHNSTEILQLFRRRRLNIKRWCSKKTNVDFIDYKHSKDILHGYEWMSIPEYKLFFCSIPKAGSSTMKDILMKSIGIVRNDKELHDQAADSISMDADRGRSPLNVPLARASRNPFYPKNHARHSLIIIRDPWKRLVSAYQNKIVEEGRDLKYFCKKYALANVHFSSRVAQTTFSEFVNCVLSNYQQQLPFFNDHFFPMNKLCAICLIDYDIIGE